MRIAELDISDEHETLSIDSTLEEAARILLQMNRGVLILLDSTKIPKGILTDSHLLKSMANGLNPKDEKSSKHMDSNILLVNLDYFVSDIIEDMKLKKPSAVVVVNSNAELQGYFSPQDYSEALTRMGMKRKV